MTGDSSSRHSILDATKSRATFSEHNKSLGAAGFISPYDEDQQGEFLSEPGETAIVNPPEGGLPNFEIGVAWDNVPMPSKKNNQKPGLLNKFLNKNKGSATRTKKSSGVDLDLGCLYELQNGKRGAIQAFGDNYGALDQAPFVHLSGDERTGDAEGEDELITVNGAQWAEIKKIVIYIYIYSGADNWQAVKPQIQVRVPGEKTMVVSLHAKREELALCAVASIENIRQGIKMTNHLEYFPGHSEMDRAFGFGLDWDEGQKS
ncbi:MAG: Tellurium resistance protein TerA [Pseudomonadota bacterium]